MPKIITHTPTALPDKNGTRNEGCTWFKNRKIIAFDRTLERLETQKSNNIHVVKIQKEIFKKQIYWHLIFLKLVWLEWTEFDNTL